MLKNCFKCKFDGIINLNTVFYKFNTIDNLTYKLFT